MKAPIVDVIKETDNIPNSVLRKSLWKDEVNDVFILTKHMEVYLYSEQCNPHSKIVLGCYCWNKKVALQLKNNGVIFDYLVDDSRMICFKIFIENLNLIFQLGAFKKRPNRYGKWIKDKERRLGHMIIPFKCQYDD